MHLYVELWNPRQQWLDLSMEKRQEFVEGVGPGIGQLTDAGIELIGFALNDENTPYRSDYRYLTVWKMPGMEQVELLEQILADVGWHELFEQVNARGKIDTPENIIGDTLSL